MNDFATHAAALGQLQARFGAACPTFTWANQPYLMIPGTVMRRGDLRSGGLQMNADLRFEVLAASMQSATLTNAEQIKDALLTTSLAYLDDVYKVDAVGIRPGGLQLVVECMSKDQNA